MDFLPDAHHHHHIAIKFMVIKKTTTENLADAHATKTQLKFGWFGLVSGRGARVGCHITGNKLNEIVSLFHVRGSLFTQT
jgi:hypothetical protein